MRKVVFILVVCGLVLLAFSASASAASKARPFHGYVVGAVSFTYDPASPSEVDFWTDSYAVGDVSHLGATVMTARHPTPVTDYINDGTMTMVAANGDEVTITYDGFLPFPVVGEPYTLVVDLDFTIVGGSGRFANASGGGDMTGYVEFPGVIPDPGPWPAYFVWSAKISY